MHRGQMWLHTPAILASGRWNQEDQKFKDSFGYIASSKASQTRNESIPKEMFKHFSNLVKKKIYVLRKLRKQYHYNSDY